MNLVNITIGRPIKGDHGLVEMLFVAIGFVAVTRSVFSTLAAKSPESKIGTMIRSCQNIVLIID
jgi:hypothetical protein